MSKVANYGLIILTKGKARRDKQPLGLVHSYLIGPFPTPSYGVSRYVRTFIDDYS